MSKKLNVSLIALVVLSVCLSVFAFSGCKPDDDEKNKKPGSVQIEVYHPNIEGKIVDCRHYWMQYDGEPKVFEIKIYSVQGKKYLTNDDLVGKDRNSLVVVAIRKNEQTNSTRIDINDPNSWPTEVGKYFISVNFNSMKISSLDDPNYYGAPAIYLTLIIEEESKDE